MCNKAFWKDLRLFLMLFKSNTICIKVSIFALLFTIQIVFIYSNRIKWNDYFFKQLLIWLYRLCSRIDETYIEFMTLFKMVIRKWYFILTLPPHFIYTELCNLIFFIFYLTQYIKTCMKVCTKFKSIEF